MASVATAPTPTTAEPEVATKKQKPERAKTPWWMWVSVAAIVLFCLFPFYWLINISLKTGNDLQSSNIIPPHPTLANYKAIFQNPDFTKALRNSAVVALVTTVLALGVGSFCAYALARLKLKGKFVILGIVLTISTFPQIAIAAPLFKLWSDIGLFNTWTGLILPYLTFALPLSIYILVSFFKEIPRDLEEAALVAGATEHEVPFGSISAASVVISVPLILLVLLFQKRIVAGLTAGAVKG